MNITNLSNKLDPPTHLVLSRYWGEGLVAIMRYAHTAVSAFKEFFKILYFLKFRTGYELNK